MRERLRCKRTVVRRPVSGSKERSMVSVEATWRA
jgi:hypothetical protein